MSLDDYVVFFIDCVIIMCVVVLPSLYLYHLAVELGGSELFVLFSVGSGILVSCVIVFWLVVNCGFVVRSLTHVVENNNN